MADPKASILVVDDEFSIRESFSLILGKDFRLITAASGEAALKKIIDEKIDLVYLDVRMPGMSGIETLKRIKQIDPSIEVIMVTAVNDVGNATAAIKLGAKDYVVKPFDVNDILNRTKAVAIKTQARAASAMGRSELIGNSAQMVNLRKAIDLAAKSGANILLEAERGLECELIAHSISVERDKQLKVLNVSHEFDMTDLFGCEKGTFTEAFNKQSGALEQADKGVLFLRNVELLPEPVQERLALALKNKEMSREGSSSVVPINVMLICETSQKLRDLVKKKLFNAALLDIISGSIIEVPPVRDREGDLPMLVAHIMDEMNMKYNKKIKISDGSLLIMGGYQWPGNITELSNTLETLVLTLGHEEVMPDDLPVDILIKSPVSAGKFTTFDHIESRFEKQHIMNVYKKAGHNKEKASEMLGIQVKTLESKLESINAF